MDQDRVEGGSMWTINDVRNYQIIAELRPVSCMQTGIRHRADATAHQSLYLEQSVTYRMCTGSFASEKAISMRKARIPRRVICAGGRSGQGAGIASIRMHS